MARSVGVEREVAMKLWNQFGGKSRGFSVLLSLGLACVLMGSSASGAAARQHPKDRPNRPPAAAERKAERRADRPPVNPNGE